MLYCWTADDLSEARLKALWLQTHSPPTDQSETATVSSDTSWENPVQEMVQNDMGKGGNREEGGGEGGEGGGEGGVEGGEGGVLGAGEEREQQAENGAPEEEVAVMAGFAKEPFVQAAAQFQHYDLTGILDLLTQAIDRGLLNITCTCTVMLLKRGRAALCRSICTRFGCVCRNNLPF